VLIGALSSYACSIFMSSWGPWIAASVGLAGLYWAPQAQVTVPVGGFAMGLRTNSGIKQPTILAVGVNGSDLRTSPQRSCT